MAHSASRAEFCGVLGTLQHGTAAAASATPRQPACDELHRTGSEQKDFELPPEGLTMSSLSPKPIRSRRVRRNVGTQSPGDLPIKKCYNPKARDMLQRLEHATTLVLSRPLPYD